MIRALCGEEKANDLFILSDTRQQIYNKRPNLAKCGIGTKGRSFKLRVSYRITRETKEFATLIGGIGYKDMNAEVEEKDVEISERRGEKPCVYLAKNKADEHLWLTGQLHELVKKGIGLDTICIVARTRRVLEETGDLLHRLGYECEFLDGEHMTGHNKLKLSTMHKIKGLEFDYVFILSANQELIPLAKALAQASDEAEKNACKRRERSLLFVAITRARKRVFLSGYGEVSEFIPEEMWGSKTDMSRE